MSWFYARCRSFFQLYNWHSRLLGGSPVESLQSHCIHTQFHWSSCPPVGFQSWETQVQTPGGYLCETGILLLALSCYNLGYIDFVGTHILPYDYFFDTLRCIRNFSQREKRLPRLGFKFGIHFCPGNIQCPFFQQRSKYIVQKYILYMCTWTIRKGSLRRKTRCPSMSTSVMWNSRQL